MTTPGLPAASAARPPRHRFWTDTRFFIGLALIVASVAGVWTIVSVSRHTVPVYAAAHGIVPGQVVKAADLTVVDVALGRVSDAYLGPDAPPAAGAVAARAIPKGELLPVSAVESADQSTHTRVVVQSASEVPQTLVAGATVEVWAAARKDGAQGAYDVPRVLIPSAVVASVTRDASVVGGGATTVELVVRRTDVPATLAAVADQSALSVVPTGSRP